MALSFMGHPVGWGFGACRDGLAREKGIPMSGSKAVHRRPFPEHYERTRIEGKEHPADIAIDRMGEVVRFQARLSTLSRELRRHVRDDRAFRSYVDARGQYETLRESLFYDAGFEHGLIHATQDRVDSTGDDSAARKLIGEITQLVLSTGLPRNRMVMLLLEAAWALVVT